MGCAAPCSERRGNRRVRGAATIKGFARHRHVNRDDFRGRAGKQLGGLEYRDHVRRRSGKRSRSPINRFACRARDKSVVARRYTETLPRAGLADDQRDATRLSSGPGCAAATKPDGGYAPGMCCLTRRSSWLERCCRRWLWCRESSSNRVFRRACGLTSSPAPPLERHRAVAWLRSGVGVGAPAGGHRHEARSGKPGRKIPYRPLFRGTAAITRRTEAREAPAAQGYLQHARSGDDDQRLARRRALMVNST